MSDPTVRFRRPSAVGRFSPSRDRFTLNLRRVRADRRRLAAAVLALALLAWTSTRLASPTPIDSVAAVEATPQAPSSAMAGDERSLTLPLPFAPPAVEPGQEVELVAVSADADWLGAEATVVASAQVVALDEHGLTVVCSRSEALAVIEALALGTVEVLGR